MSSRFPLPRPATRRTVLQKVRGRTSSCRASAGRRHRVSGSLSLPSRGTFHLSLTVLFAIGHRVVFSLGGWSPRLPARFPVSRGTPDPARYTPFPVRGSHPLRPAFPKPFQFSCTPKCSPLPRKALLPGLGSSAFARRYLRNRCFFLFLWVLRCFSSPGSLPCVMDSRMDT